MMTRTDTGQRHEAAAVVIQLFAVLLIAASLALFMLTFILAIGAGISCGDDADCAPYNFWIIAVTGNLVGQFAAVPVTLVVMKRIQRGWAAVCIYAVISLTPIVLIVWWIKLFRLWQLM